MIYKATESIGTANKNRGQREFSEIPSDCLPPKSTMHRRSTDTFIDKHDSVSEQKNKGSALDSSAAEVAPTTVRFDSSMSLDLDAVTCLLGTKTLFLGSRVLLLLTSLLMFCSRRG